MSSILAIDPGPNECGWCVYEKGDVLACGLNHPHGLHALAFATRYAAANMISHVAIEMIASYGMPVGESTFETVFEIGRLWEAWDGMGVELTKIYRKDVKMTLCHSMRAKDANIRQSIIDRYPATGGGRIPQIGTKAKPGPLYGVKSHIWSALAVAITYEEVMHDSARH